MREYSSGKRAIRLPRPGMPIKTTPISPLIEDGADLFEAVGSEPVGFIDDD